MKNFEWYLDRFSSNPRNADMRRLVRACKLPLKVPTSNVDGRMFLRDGRDYHSKDHGYIVAMFTLEESDDIALITAALNDAFLLKYKECLE